MLGGQIPEGHLSGGRISYYLAQYLQSCLLNRLHAELAAANMFPCLNDDGLNGGAGADELH